MRGTRLFQINETDLAALERELPRLLECAYSHLDNYQRAKWRQVQQVVVNIRWNYGPPGKVETIPADIDPDELRKMIDAAANDPLHDHEDVKRELGGDEPGATA